MATCKDHWIAPGRRRHRTRGHTAHRILNVRPTAREDCSASWGPRRTAAVISGDVRNHNFRFLCKMSFTLTVYMYCMYYISRVLYFICIIFLEIVSRVIIFDYTHTHTRYHARTASHVISPFFYSLPRIRISHSSRHSTLRFLMFIITLEFQCALATLSTNPFCTFHIIHRCRYLITFTRYLFARKTRTDQHVPLGLFFILALVELVQKVYTKAFSIAELV